MHISLCTLIYSNNAATYACRNSVIAYSVSLLIPLSRGIAHGDAKGSMPKIGAKVQSLVGPPHVTRQRIQMGTLTINSSAAQASPRHDATRKRETRERHCTPCNEQSLLVATGHEGRWMVVRSRIAVDTGTNEQSWKIGIRQRNLASPN